MQEPPVEFRPCAGLANRIRAFVSAICHTADDGLQLQINWVMDGGIFTAPFTWCFDPTSLPAHVKLNDAPQQFVTGLGPEKLMSSDDDWANYKMRMGVKRPYRVKAFHRWYSNDAVWLPTLRALKPAPAIAAAADAVFANFPAGVPIIGVHIRRTDNGPAIQRSPSAAFWAAMAAQPPEAWFYVASDSEEERREARRRFPGRIVVGPPELLGRSDPKGCADAMLDFICLSRCSKILGSFYSSFSEIAAAYRNVPLQIILESAPAPPSTS